MCKLCARCKQSCQQVVSKLLAICVLFVLEQVVSKFGKESTEKEVVSKLCASCEQVVNKLLASCE